MGGGSGTEIQLMAYVSSSEERKLAPTLGKNCSGQNLLGLGDSGMQWDLLTKLFKCLGPNGVLPHGLNLQMQSMSLLRIFEKLWIFKDDN